MSDFVIRPPWPDELPRIAAAFPQLQLHVRQATVHPLVLVVPEQPERLIGAAALLRSGESPEVAAMTTVGLTLALRPRCQGTATADRFFGAIQQRAREFGAKRLLATEDLRERDPRLTELLRLGFVVTRTDEIWSVPLADMVARLDRMQKRFVASGRLDAYTVISLAAADLTAVRTLIAAEGLLAPEAITVARPGAESASGYDGNISSVVMREGSVIGAMLVRRIRRIGVTEARVVAPEWRGGLNLPNHQMIHRAVSLGRAAGLEYVMFTADPTREVETIQMARRFGGTLVDRKLRPEFVLRP